MIDPVFETHFNAAGPDIRQRLEAIDAEVRRCVPGAQACIGYQMPAFRRDRIFFYFSAFKKHIGVYPPVSGPSDLIERIAPFAGPKRNLIFPHTSNLPVDLIGEVAVQLSQQYGVSKKRPERTTE